MRKVKKNEKVKTQESKHTFKVMNGQRRKHITQYEDENAI